MITHAFTCTGPYAILIMLGIKRVENRADRPEAKNGRCALSCAKSFSKEVFGAFVQWASCALSPAEFALLPSWNDVRDWPGKIVGCCDYSVRDRNDLVLSADESVPQWDEGLGYFWDLSEIVCLDLPISCRGNLGVWKLSSALVSQVNAADRLASCVGEKISTADDAAHLFLEAVSIAGGREGFFVLPLDYDFRALAAPILVSLGIDSVTTIVQPSEVFSAALKVDSKAIIVAHNHPSGDLKPSWQDYQLTRALIRQGEQLGVRVLDHLIVGNSIGSTGFLSVVASGHSDCQPRGA